MKFSKKVLSFFENDAFPALLFDAKKLLNFKVFFEEMDRGAKPESGYVFFFSF